MTMDDKEFITRFVQAHGRGPSTMELMIMQEARASKKLDEGEGQTFSVEEVGPEGGYTVQGPVEEQKPSQGDWKDGEIARLKNLLRDSLDGLERAFDEGWRTRESVKGKNAKVDDYNLYKVSESDSGVDDDV